MDHHVDLLNAASTGLADHQIIAAAVGVTLLALVLSIENYAELEGLEVSRLRAEIDIGSEALERGDHQIELARPSRIGDGLDHEESLTVEGDIVGGVNSLSSFFQQPSLS